MEKIISKEDRKLIQYALIHYKSNLTLTNTEEFNRLTKLIKQFKP